jgi:hypothetical protein
MLFIILSDTMDFSIKRILRFYLAVMLFAFVAYQVIPIQSIPQGVEFYNPSIMDVINSFIGIGSATELFNQTYSFNGGGTLSGTSQYANNLYSTGTTPEYAINNTMINFNANKVLTSIVSDSQVWGASGGQCPISATWIYMVASGWQSKATPFTATVNGVYYGSGQIGWTRQSAGGVASKIYYNIYFENVDTSYAGTLSGYKRVDYSYDTSVFTGLYLNGLDYCVDNANGNIHRDIQSYYLRSYSYLTPTYANVEYVYRSYSSGLVSSFNLGYSFNSLSTVTFNTTSSTYGYLNLTKDLQNYKFNVSANNSLVFVNTSIVNESVYTTYNKGLNFNLTFIASGDSVLRTVTDSSGTFNPTPTVAPTPIINPLTHAGILWNKNSYTVNEVGTITYLIDSSILNFLANFNIRITDQTSEVKRFDNLDVSTLTGNVQFQLPKTGSYTATLYQTICILGLCVDNSLDSKSVTVSLNPSYIYINSTVPVQTSFNATYIFGNSPLLQGGLNSVVIEFLGVDGYEPISTVSLNNSAIVGGVSYYVSLNVPKPGVYRFSLFDLSRGIISTTTANAVSTFIAPQTHVTKSILTTGKSSYFFGESILVNYAIDDTNYSNTNLQKYFMLQNIDNGIYTFPGTVLYNQIDSFELPIESGSVSAYCSQTTSTCYLSRFGYYSGNNSLMLMTTNGITNSTIVYANFTVSNTNTGGYGLDVGKDKQCTGSIITIRTSGNGTLIVKLLKSGSSTQIDYQLYNVSGNNLNNNLRLAFDGDYEFILTDTTGNVQFTRYVKTTGNCAVSGTTPTPPPGAISQGQNQAGNAWGANLLNFIAMPAFWGLLLFLIGGYVVSQFGQKMEKIMPYVLFIMLNIEAIFGLWQPFTLYVLAIVWIGAGLIGIFGALLKR